MRRAFATALAVLAMAAVPALAQDEQGGRAVPVAATGDTPVPKPKPVKAAAAGSVSIKDFSFAPKSISINVGDTVSWTNTGKQPHTATGSGFDTGTLKQGESASHTFNTAGTFNYICTIHPFMKGTVVVAAAAGSSPSTSHSQSSGSGSSGSGGSGSAGSATPGAAAQSAQAAKPGIPNTGMDVVWLALSGVLLLGSGLAIRRLTWGGARG
jgi:LPXTG-motif cell wall-anchored protein